MHQTGTFRATGRKRVGGALRKEVSHDRKQESTGRNEIGLDRKGLDLKTSRTDGSLKTPDRKRVETVVETLATLRSHGETLAEVAHDARNMVTALGLYCDLLEEPGVLATPFIHYGHELRLVAAASRRLVEKVVAIDAERERAAAAGVNITSGVFFPQNISAPAPTTGTAFPQTVDSLSWTGQGEAGPAADAASGSSVLGEGADSNLSVPGNAGVAYTPHASASRRWDLLPALPVANLAAELLANRNLLAALAGPTIALTVHAEGGARPVRLTGEDLTRVLVNLVKNATEAMPSGGRIHIGLREEPSAQGAAACLLMTVEDSGTGIPLDALETIFTSGYTSRGMSEGSNGNWTLSHRGLGLTITRSIVEGAGGRITAGNREHGGARFVLELPLRKAN
jgi:two-component sensor histidine kinase